MHDDHFLVIEAAQSWVDGYDYKGWKSLKDANCTDAFEHYSKTTRLSPNSTG